MDYAYAKKTATKTLYAVVDQTKGRADPRFLFVSVHAARHCCASSNKLSPAVWDRRRKKYINRYKIETYRLDKGK